MSVGFNNDLHDVTFMFNRESTFEIQYATAEARTLHTAFGVANQCDETATFSYLRKRDQLEDTKTQERSYNGAYGTVIISGKFLYFLKSRKFFLSPSPKSKTISQKLANFFFECFCFYFTAEFIHFFITNFWGKNIFSPKFVIKK